MFYRTMAKVFCASLAAALLCAAAGCKPAPGGPARSVLVYCTPAAEPHARVLKRVLEKRSDWQVVLAPLTAPDLLTAVDGTQAGDFAIFPEPSLQEELAAHRLLRGVPVRFDLGFYAIAKAPFALADLGLPGKRLGGYRADSPMGKALSQSLPEALRALVEANVSHRSERADELERLVRLGALDAAFVWASPPPAAGLEVVALSGETACCPLVIVSLACSRLSEAQTAAILNVWQDSDTAAALQTRQAGRKAGAP